MPRFPFLSRLACPVLIALNLSACASGSEAISQTVKMLMSRGDETAGARLSPEMHYLRAITGGHVALLVLGYVDPHPEGNIEVWYSATGEVVHLRNGRIIRTAGLSTDWREVHYGPLPAWESIGNMPIEIRRKRDELPGYRMNIEEILTLRAIAPPSDSLLAEMNPANLRWFEESLRQGGNSSLPPTRYAVSINGGKSLVMYAEQCLSMKMCFTWQRWPAKTIGAAAN